MKYRFRRVNKTLNTMTLIVGTATRYFSIIDIYILLIGSYRAILSTNRIN